ncbi:MAG: hypothetical protein RLY20_3547 [Verrucomicrobiota bacterium]
MKSYLQRFSFLAVLVAVAALAPATTRGESTNHWRFDSALNLFLAGMSGDVAVKGIPASVDSDFADIAKNLDFAAAGRFTLGYDRWALSTEFSYLKLGASGAVGSVEQKQWMVEPSVGYRLCDYAEVFAGARFNSIEANLDLNLPPGNVRGGTQSWCDPIVGATLALPLSGKKLTAEGRFDVGGFGVASDVTWQAFPYLNWRFTKSASLQLGYRWLGTEYETGSGANRFRYDVILSGPQIGLTMHL